MKRLLLLVRSGAPSVRGRYWAIAMLWSAGYLIGRTKPGWDFVHGSNNTWNDWLSIGMGLVLLVLAVFALDEYGRNCWKSGHDD